MSLAHHHVSLVHQGYMSGINGEDPDEEAAKCSEYELGWLAGYEDRGKGMLPQKYLGPCDLPIHRGDEVVIPKGTAVEHRGSTKVTRRDTKVTLHDVYRGMPAYIGLDNRKVVIRPTDSQVLWAGSGGYWSRANLSDVLNPQAGEESK